MAIMNIIQTQELTKIFQIGETNVHALNGVDVSIKKGELVAFMGPSGSGKSTLMSILGCLDGPTSGSYSLDGIAVESMTDDELSEIRNRKIGFVFQQFNLLPRTSALENVMLPLTYGSSSARNHREKARLALEKIGLADRMNHRPNELSGGEQQRVAIARALVNEPAILLADEPTGNLDTKTGAGIMDTLQYLHEAMGQTIIFVTHDPFIARHTERIIRIMDGRIVSDEANAKPVRAGTPRPEE
jgi:putative ABC transport system ATP-binding protein